MPHFNLSHTSGAVACVIAGEPLVGVDVEAMDRAGSTTDIAARFFAPPEVEVLHRLPAAAQRDCFFRFWTLKESYIKARGLGLTLPLDQFWFVPGPGEAIAIDFGPGIVDTPSRWRFVERQPTPQHRLAVAVARQRDEAWELELIEHAMDGMAIVGG
jgi:4'-phosphopantetheinyl transferase